LHPSKRFRKNEHILRTMENMLKLEDDKFQATILEKQKYLNDQDNHHKFVEQREEEDQEK